jgi:hypothetical protein
MKSKLHRFLIVLAMLALSSLNSELSTAHAQGTAFTYQGQLRDAGAPANGLYDLQFGIYNTNAGGSQVGSTQTNTATAVSNGLFTVELNFGPGIFTGSNYWLDIAARTNGSGTFTALSPRQQLTPTPYAIFANTSSNLLGDLPASQLSGTVSSASLAGTYGNAVTLDNAANQIHGSFAGNGGNVTNVNAAALNGLKATNFWQTTGNSGTSAGVNFAGTVDNQPFEIHVNSLRALRLEVGGVSALAALDGYANPTGAPNVIGGSPLNSVASGVVGAVIGGGGATNYFGTSFTNSIADYSDFSTIGGGVTNTIQSDSADSTIGGGYGNTIETNAVGSTIGGGFENTIQTNCGDSTIGGGTENTLENNSYVSTIAGGVQNTIYVNSSFIGGGQQNTIQTNADHSDIGGGWANTIGQNDYEGVISGGYVNSIENYSGYSFIGGGQHNTIKTNCADSTIAGGDANTIQATSYYSTIAGGYNNTIQNSSYRSTISGGIGNTIQPNAFNSVIGGGNVNTIETNSIDATISGGQLNIILAGADHSFIGGGYQNTSESSDSVIGGGYQNAIYLSSAYSTIAGGSFNEIEATNAFIAGGYGNVASGNCSFAAGQNAYCDDDHAFLWSDGTRQADSPGANTFTALATGGVYFYTVSPSGEPYGAYLAANSTSWSAISDRNAKKNFQPVDTKAVLDKLAAMPIQQWNYKWEKDGEVPNIGPMAQDFKAAFYPGRDDKSISTLEFDGVELAAIQGLNQKVEERDAKIQEQGSEIQKLKEKADKVDSLERQNDLLAARLNELEATVKQLVAQK